jgi:hypothetical protein
MHAIGGMAAQVIMVMMYAVIRLYVFEARAYWGLMDFGQRIVMESARLFIQNLNDLIYLSV